MAPGLDQLIDAEEASGSPVRRYLRPGIPESVVRGRLSAIGLRAPAELVELYAWHDGLDQQAWIDHGHHSNLELFPYSDFPPIDRAISDYLELKSTWQDTPWYGEYLAGTDPGWGYWRTEWFPLFWADKSRHAIDCSDGCRAPIWHVYFEPFPKTEPKHSSLSEMATDLAGYFKRGECSWSNDRQQVTQRLDFEL